MTNPDPLDDESILTHLADATDRMLDELASIRQELAARPTRQDVATRRRSGIFFVILLMFGTMQLIDLHTEACGPGHRAEVVVDDVGDAINDNDPNTNLGEVFTHAADRGTPADWCGFTFPTHAHNGRAWPQPQHIAGIVFYVFVFLAMGLWALAPRRWNKAQQDGYYGRRATDRPPKV